MAYPLPWRCLHSWIYRLFVWSTVACVLLCGNTASSQGGCQPIRIPLCQGLSWNITMFPNHMRHKTQEEAGLVVSEFYPLYRANCSPYLRQFLCAIYTPMCTWDMTLLPACGSLCQAVKDGCAPVLKQFNIDWPFRCDVPSSYIATNGGACMSAVQPSTTRLPLNDAIRSTEAARPAPSVLPGTESTPASTGHCEPLRIPMCKDANWKTTLLPNNLGHTSQEEAGMEVHKFRALLQLQCSPFLKEFLCAMHSPPCMLLNGKPLPVCRSLCVAARDGCDDVMRRYGFRWPRSLDCDSQPYFVNDTKTCFGVELKTTQVPVTSTERQSTPRRSRCRKVTSSVCDDLPWTHTALPNFAGHKTPRDSEIAVREHVPLIEMKCSPYAKLFICGVFNPKCVGRAQKVPVCRSMCESVKATCAPVLAEFGFPWPKIFDCDRRPYIVPDSERCLGKEMLPSVEPPTMHWLFTDRRTDNFIPFTTTLAPETTTKPRRCEAIRVPMCKKLPWKNTQMPNFAGQTSQREARRSIRLFIPLIRYGCSAYFKLLVCAVFEPKCDRTGRLVPVCASLCRTVKSDCMEVLNAFNLPWSDDLNCDDQSYFVPDNQTCVGLPAGARPRVTSTQRPTRPSIPATRHRHQTPSTAAAAPEAASVTADQQAEKSTADVRLPTTQGAPRGGQVTSVKSVPDAAGSTEAAKTSVVPAGRDVGRTRAPAATDPVTARAGTNDETIRPTSRVAASTQTPDPLETPSRSPDLTGTEAPPTEAKTASHTKPDVPLVVVTNEPTQRAVTKTKETLPPVTSTNEPGRVTETSTETPKPKPVSKDSSVVKTGTTTKADIISTTVVGEEEQAVITQRAVIDNGKMATDRTSSLPATDAPAASTVRRRKGDNAKQTKTYTRPVMTTTQPIISGGSGVKSGLSSAKTSWDVLGTTITLDVTAMVPDSQPTARSKPGRRRGNKNRNKNKQGNKDKGKEGKSKQDLTTLPTTAITSLGDSDTRQPEVDTFEHTTIRVPRKEQGHKDRWEPEVPRTDEDDIAPPKAAATAAPVPSVLPKDQGRPRDEKPRRDRGRSDGGARAPPPEPVTTQVVVPDGIEPDRVANDNGKGHQGDVSGVSGPGSNSDSGSSCVHPGHPHILALLFICCYLACS